jgi:hypothetical protein
MGRRLPNPSTLYVEMRMVGPNIQLRKHGICIGSQVIVFGYSSYIFADS